LQHSDNGTDWTDLATVDMLHPLELSDTGITHFAGNMLPDEPVTAQYWRILALTGGSDSWDVYSFELWQEIGNNPGDPERLAIGDVGDVLTVQDVGDGVRLPVWTPPATQAQRRAFGWFVSGAAVAGDHYGHTVIVDASLQVDAVRAFAKTAPTGAALIFDVEYSTDNGGSWASIFTTTPQLSSGSQIVDNSPTLASVTLSAGALLRLNVDQIGSSVAGSDISIWITCIA
jgi:hypothetical protein